jgi:hypothetical protein
VNPYEKWCINFSMKWGKFQGRKSVIGISE